VNSDFSCIKIIALKNNYSLVLVTEFWCHVCLFSKNGIYHRRQIFTPVNVANVEGLALSQDGKSQTHSCNLHDLQHISDISQQDYQVWSATEVHVGPLQVPTTW